MRNRNHTLPLVAVGLFIVCSSPSGANEPSATGAAKDHDCSLPANIRNKVEHCHQVGDFGGPYGRSRLQSEPGDPMYRSAPALPSQNLPTPGLSADKKSTKQNEVKKNAKKSQIIEIKSDSEPAKNTK